MLPSSSTANAQGGAPGPAFRQADPGTALQRACCPRVRTFPLARSARSKRRSTETNVHRMPMAVRATPMPTMGARGEGEPDERAGGGRRGGEVGAGCVSTCVTARRDLDRCCGRGGLYGRCGRCARGADQKGLEPFRRVQSLERRERNQQGRRRSARGLARQLERSHASPLPARAQRRGRPQATHVADRQASRRANALERSRDHGKRPDRGAATHPGVEFLPDRPTADPLRRARASAAARQGGGTGTAPGPRLGPPCPTPRRSGA